MILNDILEVVLITYNRKSFLENTLSKIFAENSPIKDLQITVLDNKSDDGSSELIEEYCKNHQNLKHIRHKKNIGGNANIARAFEIAEKKYVWVLCDDDDYDWDNWQFVEKGLEEDYDIVFTETSNFQHFKNIASYTRAATFLPSVIYKTDLITDDALTLAYSNTINLFPHLAFFCDAINQNKKIHTPDKSVVIIGNRPKKAVETGFYRGIDKYIHPHVKNMFLIVGYINSVQLIKDKKQRTFILNHMSCKKTGFFREISANFKRNRLYYENSFKNICDVFCGINFWQKCQFIVALVWLDIIYFIKKFILRDKRYK